MFFIKLTSVTCRDDTDIFVNMDKVGEICPTREGSVIIRSGMLPCHVRETPQKIMGRLCPGFHNTMY